jgi:carbamoyltransferase
MKILGIADGMTGGTALWEDGRLVYAIHEERLMRAKMATGFPHRAITQILEDTGTAPEEVDAVAVATVHEYFVPQAEGYDGWLRKDQGPLKEAMLSLSGKIPRYLGARPFMKRSYYGLKSFLGRKRRRAIPDLLRQGWGLNGPVRFIDHHYAHACSAYYTGGRRRATIITMDGAGDHCCSHVYSAEDGRFTRLCALDSFDSIGNYYAYVTHICGFKAQKHEGKITGLAAYGEPVHADTLRRFIDLRDGRIVNTGQVFYWSAVDALRQALPRGYRDEDLAASVQQVLEDVCGGYARHWVDRTGFGDVVLAGGVFANVKLNQRIHELDNVDSVFIHPGMGDEGLAVGAALALAAELQGRENGRLETGRIADVYWGPSYSEKEMEGVLRQAGITFQHHDDIEKQIARLLAEGRVVARFDGRMEYGPRALGSRSILYQPTDPTVNDWLNKRLQRTEFMPFAPVTLAEHADDNYVNMDGGRYPARFMTITFNCTEWMKKHCPAVVHVDGTARPQIIDRQTNPSYYGIIDEYRKITGLPTIINTSFNIHEEPIVCTPADAIRAFQIGHLDYLAMGPFLVPSEGNVSKADDQQPSRKDHAVSRS